MEEKYPSENKIIGDRKSIPLVRALGLFTGVLLVAGVMIGSGVFKKIIPMAQTGLDESSILMAWVIAGIITMFGAFTLSGLSSITEESGGVYEYLRLSFGNFFSFLFGWTDFTIMGSASVAAVAYIFAQTVHALTPLPNPLTDWEHVSIGNFIFPFADSGIKLFAIAAIILLTWINYRGVQKGGMVSNVVTSAKILGIPAGDLSPNSDADICIFDANEYWTINPTSLKSQGKNTPFNGLEMAGKVKFTLVHGQVVFQSQ